MSEYKQSNGAPPIDGSFCMVIIEVVPDEQFVLDSWKYLWEAIVGRPVASSEAAASLS